MRANRACTVSKSSRTAISAIRYRLARARGSGAVGRPSTSGSSACEDSNMLVTVTSLAIETAASGAVRALTLGCSSLLATRLGNQLIWLVNPHRVVAHVNRRCRRRARATPRCSTPAAVAGWLAVNPPIARTASAGLLVDNTSSVARFAHDS
jgi:hypothetical protein